MPTKQAVIQIVGETLEMPAEEIRPADRFVDDLGASSLDIVNLIWRLEEEYGLPETPESELEGLETVGDVVGLVERLRGDGGEASVAEAAQVVLASDHAGVEMKADLVDYLREQGRHVADLGPTEIRSVDYPDFAELVGRAVGKGEAPYGILICGSGIGMSIAANKVAGVRAAMVSEPISAGLSRQHNDANVLCLGARLIGRDMARACVDAFLSTDFEPGDDGRHQRRVGRIAEIQDQNA